MCGVQCRSDDTVTKKSVFLCQCHSTNDIHRTLQLYSFCQKDERAKPWSFQIGSGLLDLRERWIAECLHDVVVGVISLFMTGISFVIYACCVLGTCRTHTSGTCVVV